MCDTVDVSDHATFFLALYRVEIAVRRAREGSHRLPTAKGGHASVKRLQKQTKNKKTIDGGPTDIWMNCWSQEKPHNDSTACRRRGRNGKRVHVPIAWQSAADRRAPPGAEPPSAAAVFPVVFSIKIIDTVVGWVRGTEEQVSARRKIGIFVAVINWSVICARFHHRLSCRSDVAEAGHATCQKKSKENQNHVSLHQKRLNITPLSAMAGITIMLVLIFSRTHRATVNLFGRWAFISLESGMVYSRVGAAVAEWRQKGERKKVREREREKYYFSKKDVLNILIERKRVGTSRVESVSNRVTVAWNGSRSHATDTWQHVRLTRSALTTCGGGGGRPIRNKTKKRPNESNLQFQDGIWSGKDDGGGEMGVADAKRFGRGRWKWKWATASSRVEHPI